MNPLTKMKLINELNEQEAQLGVAGKISWHSQYKESAWIFLGGLPHELTEGDVICVFSQYGEVVNINLARNEKTGKSKGFCFLCYEDQRSTILAVDNFNGIKIKGRTIRVDHVSNYRPPKDSEEMDDVTRKLQEKGCGANTPQPESPENDEPTKKSRKHKKEKKDKRKTGREVQPERPPSSSSPRSKVRKEKDGPGSKKRSGESPGKTTGKPAAPPVVKASRWGGSAQGPGREPRKEKHRHEPKFSGRQKASEDENRDGAEHGAQTPVLAGAARTVKGGVAEGEREGPPGSGEGSPAAGPGAAAAAAVREVQAANGARERLLLLRRRSGQPDPDRLHPWSGVPSEGSQTLIINP
ncbi:RNA-binding motif protein, X-linked 2-like [Ctenodactylus gundi]